MCGYGVSQKIFNEHKYIIFLIADTFLFFHLIVCLCRESTNQFIMTLEMQEVKFPISCITPCVYSLYVKRNIIKLNIEASIV